VRLAAACSDERSCRVYHWASARTIEESRATSERYFTALGVSMLQEARRLSTDQLLAPLEKMTISSFPPISILAKWNSMKEDAKEFFSSFQRNSLNSTRNTHCNGYFAHPFLKMEQI
jgi:hypothetical protein